MKDKLFEDDSHSFIVKIWREGAAEANDEATWRGHITHVPSGERRYVKSLRDVTDFIAPYLGKMGVKDVGNQREKWWQKRRQPQPVKQERSAGEQERPRGSIEEHDGNNCKDQTFSTQIEVKEAKI